MSEGQREDMTGIVRFVFRLTIRCSHIMYMFYLCAHRDVCWRQCIGQIFDSQSDVYCRHCHHHHHRRRRRRCIVCNVHTIFSHLDLLAGGTFMCWHKQNGCGFTFHLFTCYTKSLSLSFSHTCGIGLFRSFTLQARNQWQPNYCVVKVCCIHLRMHNRKMQYRTVLMLTLKLYNLLLPSWRKHFPW